MSDLPRHLKLLDKQLLELPGEPMLVSELDGFLTGIIVCPELIMPSEWLPLVWGAEDDEAVFENSRQAEKLVRLVMEHYNSIAGDLTHRPGHYSPILEVDTRHNETLWELWIDGFYRAMQLRPSAWTKLLLADEDTRTAYAGLVTLAEINSGDSKLPSRDIDDLTERAPDMIPIWVERLNDWRLSQHPAGLTRSPRISTTKVGRNDTCPCGSGKKYKKCCGLN